MIERRAHLARLRGLVERFPVVGLISFYGCVKTR
jgi:hypothetical protein